MNKINWGILSTAKIGINKVIPAMQAGKYCTVTAIASRDPGRARAVARQLGIPKSYGSYDELLADADVQAIYNPLPNHLHVPWSIKALEAGKHVLCEKPIGLTTAEAQQLLDAAKKHPQLKIMEAFMYRHHPQWQLARKLVSSGKIGELRAIHTFFSYSNLDPKNIRNMADVGGGGLMDIGCYCISVARFLFNSEPRRILGQIKYDPAFGTDRLASGILEFEHGTATFTCSTQLAPYQRVNILGTKGRIELEVPFNAPPDRPSKLLCQTRWRTRELVLKPCDQYTIQGDLFARAILEDKPVPTPLEDAVANMRVIEAITLSARSENWVLLD